ncbi:MAG TPA: glycosyltransferase family 4 protein [Ignavibacteria bacterium]
MNIIITAPSLDTNINVSGVSSVTNFIIENNSAHNYTHFKLGKSDIDKRGFFLFFRILKAWISWGYAMVFRRDVFVHFNFALDKRSIIRDSPLILFARLRRKKMVIHLHGGEYLHKEVIPKWISILLRFIFSGNEPKIVLSPIEKKIIVNKYHAKNVVDLPNSIDIKEARKYIRIYPCEHPVKLLFIGRIVKRKGIEYILQALTILKEREIDFKFILAGTGPDQSEYVNRCYAIFGSAFEFKGVVSGLEKAELLKKCDIFLLPSLNGEGLPISLLECMSFEQVPVVTDDGSMKYIIKTGENGIIVEKGSSTSLAEAIENLILNKKFIEKIGKSARQYVFENHDPVVYINKLNKIYDNE